MPRIQELTWKAGNGRYPALRKNLRAIYSDGLGYSLMVGLGETYIPAFALALGMSEVATGWIVSIPLLAGAMLQMISPQVVQLLGSHRRWVVASAFIQALSLFAFLVLAWMGRVPSLVVFALATVYWGSNLATGPAWNTWVGRLVPRNIRAEFFARRSRACQALVMTGTVAGGIALYQGAHHWNELYVFALLFLAAGISRLVSSFFLWSQSEPPPHPDSLKKISLASLYRRAREGSEGRLLVYMLAVQAAVQISGPFFTPYMLVQLDFSYFQYLVVICTAFAAKMIAFPLLGKAAKRWGSQWVLYLSGFGIVPMSALWILSDALPYLLVIQVLAGIAWAGYELSTFLLLFERIEESERTSMLTAFNLANAAAFVFGALIGGLLLRHFGSIRESYLLLFGLSGAGRLVSLVLLARLRRVTFKPVPIATRTLAVRANTGSIAAPIVTSLDPRKHENGQAAPAELPRFPEPIKERQP